VTIAEAQLIYNAKALKQVTSKLGALVLLVPARFIVISSLFGFAGYPLNQLTVILIPYPYQI
jgi:hypothetical protein